MKIFNFVLVMRIANAAARIVEQWIFGEETQYESILCPAVLQHTAPYSDSPFLHKKSSVGCVEATKKLPTTKSLRRDR